MIYFARPLGKAGPVKIGCSSNPTKRLEAMAVLCPFPVELVAVMEGGLDREAFLHRRFADARVHGEWYEPVEPIVRLMERHALAVPLVRGGCGRHRSPPSRWPPLHWTERKFERDAVRSLRSA